MLVDQQLNPVLPPYVDAEGAHHPRDIELRWTAGELALKGWFKVTDDPQPIEGLVISSNLVWRAGEVWREWVVDPVSRRRYVDIALILDRLEAGGFKDAATAAFDQLDRWTRERFYARTRLWVEDPTTLALLQSIGADPAIILAPPSDG